MSHMNEPCHFHLSRECKCAPRVRYESHMNEWCHTCVNASCHVKHVLSCESVIVWECVGSVLRVWECVGSVLRVWDMHIMTCESWHVAWFHVTC